MPFTSSHGGVYWAALSAGLSWQQLLGITPSTLPPAPVTPWGASAFFVHFRFDLDSQKRLDTQAGVRANGKRTRKISSWKATRKVSDSPEAEAAFPSLNPRFAIRSVHWTSCADFVRLFLVFESSDETKREETSGDTDRSSSWTSSSSMVVNVNHSQLSLHGPY